MPLITVLECVAVIPPLGTEGGGRDGRILGEDNGEELALEAPLLGEEYVLRGPATGIGRDDDGNCPRGETTGEGLDDEPENEALRGLVGRGEVGGETDAEELRPDEEETEPLRGLRVGDTGFGFFSPFFLCRIFGDAPGDELAEEEPDDEPPRDLPVFGFAFPFPALFAWTRRGEREPLRDEDEPDDEPLRCFLPFVSDVDFFFPDPRERLRPRFFDATFLLGFRCRGERDLSRRPRTPFSIWANSIHCCAACASMGAGPSCSMRSSKSPMDGA